MVKLCNTQDIYLRSDYRRDDFSSNTANHDDNSRWQTLPRGSMRAWGEDPSQFDSVAPRRANGGQFQDSTSPRRRSRSRSPLRGTGDCHTGFESWKGGYYSGSGSGKRSWDAEIQWSSEWGVSDKGAMKGNRWGYRESVDAFGGTKKRVSDWDPWGGGKGFDCLSSWGSSRGSGSENLIWGCGKGFGASRNMDWSHWGGGNSGKCGRASGGRYSWQGGGKGSNGGYDARGEGRDAADVPTTESLDNQLDAYFTGKRGIRVKASEDGEVASLDAQLETYMANAEKMGNVESNVCAVEDRSAVIEASVKVEMKGTDGVVPDFQGEEAMNSANDALIVMPSNETMTELNTTDVAVEG